jgi:SAM-dependent methyltransferase
VGDAGRLPFGDGSFDAVINVESSHCYGNISAFLSEVRRVLRPGGRFLYADFRPRDEVAGWRASLAAAGFVIEAERDLRPGVVAALDADDDRKRALIGHLVDRPLAHIFREFAALRGAPFTASCATETSPIWVSSSPSAPAALLERVRGPACYGTLTA